MQKTKVLTVLPDTLYLVTLSGVHLVTIGGAHVLLSGVHLINISGAHLVTISGANLSNFRSEIYLVGQETVSNTLNYWQTQTLNKSGVQSDYHSAPYT